MELNFHDINDNFDNNTFDVNNYQQMNNIEMDNYWEKQKKEPSFKKKVNFADILSNMNLVVNEKGVLQYISYKPEPNQYNPNQNNQYKANQKPNQNNEQLNPQKPLDPAVKNSFIYNKYFKDYKDYKEAPEQKVPKTIEEYKKMVLEDKIKRIQETARIEQIKSKQILFENVKNIRATNNNLRRMNFY